MQISPRPKFIPISSSNACARFTKRFIHGHRTQCMDTSHLPVEAQTSPRSFAALLDRDYDRADFLKHLKTLIAAAEGRIRQEHHAGTRGRNVVRHLTALADDVIRTIFQYVRRQGGAAPPPCVLLALGGYGRG